jgi:IS30 family transposase
MQEQKYMRLTIGERRSIEQGLKERLSIRLIATSLGRSTSTISREIVRNSVHRKIGGSNWEEFNDCANRDDCEQHGICSNPNCERSFCCGCPFCFRSCRDYIRERCRRVEQAPYVCNGCKSRRSCTLEKVLYKAGVAQKSADDVLRNTRAGIDMTEEERRRLDDIISPLIKKSQSPYHIIANNRDVLMISEKTLYTYIAAGLFSAKSTDLKCKVRMKPRKTKPVLRIDRSYMDGRTHEDFIRYMEEHPDTGIVEMDSVIGKKGRGEKVLLTIHFPQTAFMLAFIRDANTSRSVSEIFCHLREVLGHETFSRMFPLINTDRGSEFTNPAAIERDEKGHIWTKVYYCDPYSPYQKPWIENNHRLLRMILRKGSSFNELTQDKVNLMMSHVNSYTREVLGGKAPIDEFARIFGWDVVKKLGLRKITANDITLNPSLLN